MKATFTVIGVVLPGLAVAGALPAEALPPVAAQSAIRLAPALTPAPVESPTPVVGLDVGAPQWERLSPDASPGPAAGYPMVYDASLQAMVMFTSSYDETWTWDGSNWQQQHPETSPGPRYHTAMAYNPLGEETVLFGGWYDHDFHDTWIYKDGDWAYNSSIEVPLERQSHVMAFDPNLGQVVMFGGIVGNEDYLDDTWAWDGDNWNRLTPENALYRRLVGAFAYDPTRGALVLFGGEGPIQSRDDTWVWDGVDWTRETLRRSPSPRSLMAAATFGRHVAVFSGYNFTGGVGEQVADRHLWLLKAHTWKKLSLDPDPRRRHSAMFAWNTDRGEAVLYGGTNLSGDAVSDTWTLRRGQGPTQ